MGRIRSVTVVIPALTVFACLYVVAQRGGLIAWVTLILALALLLKALLRPGRRDLGAGIGLAVMSALLWGAIFYAVISTYESGEVVELTIDTQTGEHTARLWVMDIDEQPLVYIDAQPAVAQALLAGKPLQFDRGGRVSTRFPSATRTDAMSQTEAARVLQAMNTKYGARTSAADAYYLLLGRPRDRVALVVSLLSH